VNIQNDKAVRIKTMTEYLFSRPPIRVKIMTNKGIIAVANAKSMFKFARNEQVLKTLSLEIRLSTRRTNSPMINRAIRKIDVNTHIVTPSMEAVNLKHSL